MAKAIAQRASSPKLKPAPQPRVTPHVLEEITRHIVEAVQPEKVILFGSYA